MRPLLLSVLWLLATIPTGPVIGAPSPLRAQLTETVALFRAQKYQEAERQSQQLIADAKRVGDWRTAARATGNVGAMRFALRQYRSALAAFLEARGMAVAQHDVSETAALDANLASLYMEMGDTDEAARRIEGVLGRLTGDDRRDHTAETQILLAQLRARQGRMPEALRLFRLGMAGAESANDWKLVSFAWNRLGEEYLQQGNFTAAEPALLEAYRIRVLRGLALDTSYRNLGRLKLEQGDLDTAEVLLNRAIELATQPQGPIPSWDAFHYRGRVRLARGQLAAAMTDLRTALRLARAWRWSAPPDDSVRIGAETWLDRVYSAFIDAGNRLYLKTGDASLICETFEAAEENRASSLRMLLRGRIAAAETMPAAYWPAVTRLQKAEVEAARMPSPEADQQALSAREALAQIESDAFGNAPITTRGLLRRVQTALAGQTYGNGTAVMAFHLGSPDSWLWAVDRQTIKLYRLPDRAAVDALAVAFSRDFTQAASVNPSQNAGRRLYNALFGELDARWREKSRWLLALDDSLFSVPFAALPEGGAYLAKARTIEIIPGAALWSPAKAPAGGTFLGVGDAIYNAADPRRTAEIRSVSSHYLPRLVASAPELAASARGWNGPSLTLEGASASREDLKAALASHPALVHFAAHFIEGPNSNAAIVLSLGASGQDILEAGEIASWRVNARLVTLSGCRSASGRIRPGTGLLGLTRAWLAAGAGAVLATHWETPDDSGPLFAAFYNQLARGQTPAGALRAAQLAMASAGDWRSDPRYWAAYFVMGKE